MSPPPCSLQKPGWATAAPVVLAVTGFGISYGVLAAAAGLQLWHIAAASALVFAGSSQFGFVSLVAAGSSPVEAAASAVLLNLRYVATGAAIAPALRGPRPVRFLAAQLVVDESYALAVAAGEPGEPDGRTAMTTGAALWAGWTSASLAGALLGPVFGEPETLGLDAAFPALFVALLWPMLTGRWAIRAALAGVAAALALQPFAPQGIALAGAAVAGAAVYRG